MKSRIAFWMIVPWLAACVVISPSLALACLFPEIIPCDACHRAEVPVGAWREAMCLNCHGPGGSSSLRALSHAELDCFDCHDTHGGEINRLGKRNLKDLRADVDKTGQHSNSSGPRARNYRPPIDTPSENRVPVVFESRGTTSGEPSLHSFADDDEDGDGIYDGICEACHPRNPQSIQHHRGETCTSCHLHNRGFRAGK